MINHSKPWIHDDDIRSVNLVLYSENIAQGQMVCEFEASVARYNGFRMGAAVSSGTAALVFALKALHVQDGDEVIIPTYVCRNVADAVLHVGALPVFCDVDFCWNMTAELTEKHISPRTKAIVVVHLFGIPIDVRPFVQLGLPVIEDGCQAFGAENNKKKVGMVGDMGIFSFHATKCLTTGEGGMIVTNSEELAGRILDLCGDNSIVAPMSDIQASLGISQLSRYDEFLKRRKKLAHRYFDELPEYLMVRMNNIRNSSIFYRFLLTSDIDFHRVQETFLSHDIAIRRGVDALLHRKYGLSDDAYLNAAQLFDTTISIPIYPSLTDDEQEQVIQACSQILT